MNFAIFPRAAAALASLLLAFAPFAAAKADSGFYLGGSVGNASVEADINDPSLPSDFTFDEDDFAWKLFGGYTWDLPLIDLGIEGSYLDLGGPSVDILGESFSIDTTGFDAFGVAGIGLGPIHAFAKYGVIFWDADFEALGQTISDDGSDPAYGIGARFGLWSLDVRAEYEIFDIDGADDFDMWSVGLSWTF